MLMRHKALRNSSKSVGIKFISDEKQCALFLGCETGWWKIDAFQTTEPCITD